MSHESRRLFPCLFIATALLGCVPELEEEQGELRVSPTVIEAIRDAACVDERRVAWAPVGQGPCPIVNGWEASKLFEDGPGQLGNYCVYEGAGGQGVSAQQLELLDAQVLAQHRDCEVVFEQSNDPLSTALAPTLQAAFYDSVNRADAEDLDLPVNEGLRAPVTVAVVDTTPDPVPVDARSEHGESMAAFVHDVACPSGAGLSCAVGVRNELGMPRIEGRLIDPVNGGFYGSFVDLARGIYRAVEDTPANAKLVINLSLGWEPEFFGGDPSTSVPIDAVHSAIEYARCHGAVVIAAAGNAGHLCETGPLLPGGWELDDAPSALRCAELDVVNPVIPTATYSPLVYAVGGIGYDSKPAPTSRSGSMPRLVATGVHGVPNLANPRSALTGSSVPTAVVSGTAALLWSFYPQLSVEQLMQTIYFSGEMLGPDAAVVGVDAWVSEVRRLDICAAVEAASARLDTAELPAPLGCLEEAPEASIEDVLPLVEVLPTTSFAPIFSTPAQPCSSGCVSGSVHAADGVAKPACPAPVPPTLPFATPQPTHPACPSCTIDPGDAKVYASLDDEYASYTIEDVMVTVYEGATPTFFRTGPTLLTSAGVETIELESDRVPPAADSATITITFAELPRPNESTLIFVP
ncbi:S8/S53 family peptidase [Plesiocystis pacifica]|nr:S8/S53 family peptidase [Plesiocystis pacifica]